jgi:hypothetical protein
MKDTLMDLIHWTIKAVDKENQCAEQARMAFIEESIEALKATVLAKPTMQQAGPKTWTQITATPQPAQYTVVEAARYKKQEKLKQQRYKTEVTLSFKEAPANNVRAREVKTLSETAIADCLKESSKEAAPEDSPLRAIKNINVKKVSPWWMKVICDSEEDATKLHGAINWEQVMGAKIAANMHGVVVHVVAKNDADLEDPKTTEKVVKEVSTANSINIVHSAPLLRKPWNPGAPTHSIIMYTDNINDADKLILYGIHIGNQHYNTKKYLPRCQLIQCFKC